MALEFEKINESCSNIYLIDERLCLKNSYEILNTNVSTLTSNLNTLQTYSNNFNSLYTTFSNNSSRWIKAINNFQTLSAGWFSAETTVKTLSTYWADYYHVIYNKIIDLNTFYLNQNVHETYISNWLNAYFNSEIVDGQVIKVDLYLSDNESFTWSYYKSYYESCEPTNQNRPSGDCNCPKPSYWCNHLALNGKEKFPNSHTCVNAMDYCGVKATRITGGGTPPRCPARTPDTIILDYKNTQTDKSLARVITLDYKKINNFVVKI